MCNSLRHTHTHTHRHTHSQKLTLIHIMGTATEPYRNSNIQKESRRASLRDSNHISTQLKKIILRRTHTLRNPNSQSEKLPEIDRHKMTLRVRKTYTQFERE